MREHLLDKLQQCVLENLETNPSEALRLGELWQGMEPYDLEALTLSLRILQKLGDKRKLERLYEQGVKRFKEVEETLPATVEEFLLTKV